MSPQPPHRSNDEPALDAPPPLRPKDLSDRELLRWACRQSMPCAVLLPGQTWWGRSFLVDLREGGPRPSVAIAEARDAVSGDPRPLPSGVALSLWSVREGEPWHLRGYVAGKGVVEGRDRGPVPSVFVRLPYRLLETDRRLGGSAVRDLPRLTVSIEAEGPRGPGPTMTLFERWSGRDGSWRHRGAAHLIEASRRTLCLSVPSQGEWGVLQGAPVRLHIDLPDLRLRSSVSARVAALLHFGGQVLYGFALGQPVGGITEPEHREVLRHVARWIF